LLVIFLYICVSFISKTMQIQHNSIDNGQLTIDNIRNTTLLCVHEMLLLSLAQFKLYAYFCSVLAMVHAPLSWERLRSAPQLQRGFFIKLWYKGSKK
jgi:hypothetical protein